MKRFSVISSALALSLLLTACGSLQGGDRSNDGNDDGKLINQKSFGGDSDVNKVENKKRLIVVNEGNKVNVIDLAALPKGDIGVETNSGTFIGYNLDYSYYGAWINDGRFFHEFKYGGLEPTNIPLEGKATYHGHAVTALFEDSDRGIKREIIRGSSLLNIDFSNKVVNGVINIPGKEEQYIHLENGTLNKDTFLGTAYADSKQSLYDSNNGTFEGYLHGRDAKDMVGYVKFSDAPTLDTIFGGTRGEIKK